MAAAIAATSPLAAAPSVDRAADVTAAVQVRCAGPASRADGRVSVTTQPAQPAWGLTRGAGVTVAVLGLGVDGRTPGPAGRDCTGTISGGLLAVAPGATVLPVLVNGPDGSADPATVAAGLAAAIAHHASVVLVTTSPAGDDTGLRVAVRAALAAGAVVVAGVDPTGRPGYPAAYPGVLAVATVGPDGAGSVDNPQTGSAPRVDLVAAGSDQGSGTDAAGSTADDPAFAAGVVAGAAALVRSRLPALSGTQVAARLLATADHAPGAVPSTRWGWGTVDPYAAVAALDVPPLDSVRGDRVRTVDRPVRAAPPDTRRRDAALVVGVIAVVLAAGSLTAAVVVRAARRRAAGPQSAVCRPDQG